MLASKVLPAAIVLAMLLSVNAPISFAVSPQDGGPVCARELPSGSTVDPSAGTVMLPNGSIVAMTEFPCSMTNVVWPPASDRTSENAVIGQYLPLASVVVVAIVLLYLVARRRPMRDVEPSSGH